MDEQKARELLAGCIDHDGGLYSLGWYLGWTPGDNMAVLDGEFTADDLEAIAFWMRRSSTNSHKSESEKQ